MIRVLWIILCIQNSNGQSDRSKYLPYENLVGTKFYIFKYLLLFFKIVRKLLDLIIMSHFKKSDFLTILNNNKNLKFIKFDLNKSFIWKIIWPIGSTIWALKMKKIVRNTIRVTFDTAKNLNANDFPFSKSFAQLRLTNLPFKRARDY
jgi:hypothetical protein